ncbi:MAG: insulinase family protein [Gammaproteobacteria bacterium]|jgi:predicted Zn-dependent peptidase|nr:insulinase family protein [Gammaproteobacteria bacterium]
MNRYTFCRRSLAATLLVLAVTAQAAAASGIQLPAYQQIQLENGATLVLLEKHDVPLVTFSASLRGGLIAEPAEKNGVASLTSQLLQKGAGVRDAKAFAEAVAAVGGVFDVSANLEYLGLSGEFMARDTDLMISLLADVLRRPQLRQAEFDKLRNRAIQSLAAMKDSDARGLVGIYARALVFGNHPYAGSDTGSEASLARVSYQDAKDYARDNLSPERLLLVIAGDFDPSAMRSRVEKALDGWTGVGAKITPVPVAKRVPGGRVLLVDKPGATQTYFWMGNIGVSRSDPDKVAIDLVNTLFGGRFTSMLNTALRIETGLTYGARSSLDMPSQPGTVAIQSYTATATTIEAVDLALEQLKSLRTKGLDETQLRSGKTYRQGLFPMGFETAKMLAGQLMSLKFYGLDDNSVNDYARDMEGVSAEKAAAVISRVYPGPNDLVYVFIGNSEVIGEQLEKYGKVTRMSITDSDWTASGE